MKQAISNAREGDEGPLSGVRIVDLSTVFAAPFATHLLADAGAEVIKVEAPDLDILRDSGEAPEENTSPMFEHINRSKRGIVIDLKNQVGRDILLRILSRSDALVSNIRPDALTRLGIDYATLRPNFPRLIHCSIVGYGAGGRSEGRPAYDDMIQGAAAFSSLLGQATDSAPRHIPFALIDRIAGIYAANAISLAILSRERSGEGSELQVPLFESAVHFLLVEHMFGRSFDPPVGTAINKRMIEPDRKPYATRDGFLCVLPYGDRHWEALFQIMDKPEYLADPRFRDFPSRRKNLSVLYALLVERLPERTTSEWMRIFEEADIPSAPVVSVDQLLDDGHLAERGFFVESPFSDGVSFKHVRTPVEWSNWSPPAPTRAPKPSEHAEEILRESGMAESEIEDAFASNAVRQRGMNRSSIVG
jgi:crotonobetainyl-CoA:carnitine CoA-transferase CaiB-like acyl-CoA transferase